MAKFLKFALNFARRGGWRLAVAGLVSLAASAALAQDRPQVIAVNPALQAMAAQLLGPEVDVIYPVPEGIDPSFWRPRIADISIIQGADLILLNGAGFATWIDRVSLPRRRVVTTTAELTDRLIATQSIVHSHGDGGEHSHAGQASYVWLDPDLALAQAEAIAAAVTARGLAAEADVTAGLAQLRGELDALKSRASEALQPVADVPMIATHPRYQYLARAFGLSIASLEWEAGVMPTDDDLAALTALREKTGAHVLIWEAQPPAEAIAAVEALGLASVVFPPLVAPAGDQSFAGTLEASIERLAEAAAKAAQ